MKIAILTFARTNNYGATLQCYALSRFLQEKGHSVIVINVPLGSPSYDGMTRNMPVYSFLRKIKRFIGRKLKGIFPFLRKKCEENQRYERTKKQLKTDADFSDLNMIEFDKFRQRFFPPLTSIYNDESDFSKNKPQADLYITGSDQVWNLWITNQKKYIILKYSSTALIKYKLIQKSRGKLLWNISL
jgi:hypothetical protein